MRHCQTVIFLSKMLMADMKADNSGKMDKIQAAKFELLKYWIVILRAMVSARAELLSAKTHVLCRMTTSVAWIFWERFTSCGVVVGSVSFLQ